MSSSIPPPESSFAAMDKGDVEAIGAHCQYTYCHQLDFLPFKCLSCKKTFCLDHRTETTHECANAGEWARSKRSNDSGSSTPSTTATRKPTLLNAQQCSEVACKTFINTSQNMGVHCQDCNRHYCLKHRFREDHDCKNLTPLGARPSDVAVQSNAEKLKSGFGRLKTWGKGKQEELRPKPRPKPTSKAAQLVALNNLKKTAKGDDKVPSEKRVYLHVEAESVSAEAKAPAKKALFFNQEWRVGKMLDDAASKLNVQNVNNRVDSEEQRLRVYHVESGAVLDFGEKVGQRLVNGNTIVLLRGIGPSEGSAST